MENFADEYLVGLMIKNKGDEKHDAFHCLYRRHFLSVTKYLYFMLQKDIETAQDFCQDFFLCLFEKPEMVDTSKNFKAWMYRVISNKSKNHFRSINTSRKYINYVQNFQPIAEDLSTSEIELNESIKTLKEGKRALLVLRFKLNFSVKEIAEIYECPEGTIKSKLFYTIKELSKKIKK